MRLFRSGKKRFATWRVVIADSRKAVTAKVIDDLGWYNPHTKEFNADKVKIKNWLNKGAQPSNTLAILFEKNKIEMPSWVTIKRVEPKKIVTKDVEVVQKEKEVSKEEQVTKEIVTETKDLEENIEKVVEEENTEEIGS